MARVIGLKAGTIEGDVTVTGAEKNISCSSLSMGASAHVTYDSDGGGQVSLSSVTLTIKYGQWIGDLQKALFDGLIMDTVTIVEVDQKSADQGNAEAKLVRTLKLTNAYIEALGISWQGPNADAVISFMFEKWDLTYEAKAGAKMASRDLMALS